MGYKSDIKYLLGLSFIDYMLELYGLRSIAVLKISELFTFRGFLIRHLSSLENDRLL